MSRLSYLFPNNSFSIEAPVLYAHLLDRLRMHHGIVLDDVVKEVLEELCERAVTNEDKLDKLTSEVDDLKGEVEDAKGDAKDAESDLRDAERERDDAKKRLEKIEGIVEGLPDSPVIDKIRDMLEDFEHGREQGKTSSQPRG